MSEPRIELWRTVPEGARELPRGGVCPVCRSPRVHRSRTKGTVERLLRAVGPWRPFACGACQWRGWTWPEIGQGPTVELPPAAPAKPRRKRSGTPRKHARPPVRASGRLARQLVVALVLALAMGATFVYCQQAPPIVTGDN